MTEPEDVFCFVHPISTYVYRPIESNVPFVMWAVLNRPDWQSESSVAFLVKILFVVPAVEGIVAMFRMKM
jgi:hypothetical protein